LSSPWNQPKLIAKALSECDRRELDDIDALLHFCRTQFNGPLHAAPVLFTVYCTVLAYLWNDGVIGEDHLKTHGKLLRDCVKQSAKVLRKQSN
jgi:hypothetical protein